MDIEQELRQTFLIEASELLDKAEQALLELEQTSEPKKIIELIFRQIHTVKGASGAGGFPEIGAFAHEVESLLSEIKNDRIGLSTVSINLLLRSNDHLAKCIQELSKNNSATFDSSHLLLEIAGYLKEPAKEKPESFGFFDDPLVIADQPLSSKPSQTNPEDSAKLEPVVSVSTIATPQSDESVRVSLGRVDRLVRCVGEMATHQGALSEYQQTIDQPEVRATIEHLAKIGKEIQDLVMGLRMIPLRQTFQKLRRVARDSAQGLGKMVEMIFEGEETEVDKSISEQLDGPLVHLVRNAIDHGVESPAERESSGKLKAATVRLVAFQKAGRLILEITDDGRGLDPNKLRKKAIEKGLIRPDQDVNDRDAINLIFRAGFSTKEQVTDISGRGVGMDVVKTTIDGLKGKIEISSKLNFGSTFRISLPLSLSIFNGFVMRCGLQRYVLPISQVRKMIRVEKGTISSLTGLGEMAILAERKVPIIRLNEYLQVDESRTDSEKKVIVLVNSDQEEFGILVDDVIGQQQIVVRKLGPELHQVDGISGTTVLGDGLPVLLIDIKVLHEMWKKHSIAKFSRNERKLAVV